MFQGMMRAAVRVTFKTQDKAGGTIVRTFASPRDAADGVAGFLIAESRAGRHGAVVFGPVAPAVYTGAALASITRRNIDAIEAHAARRLDGIRRAGL